MAALAYARSGGAMAMGEDETQQRRAIPPFPWAQLRFILLLGGEYAGDTRANPVPISTRNVMGIRWQSLEHPERAAVGTAVARAFKDGGDMTAAHWNVFMATELGMVPRPDPKGVKRWCIYNSEHSNAVMPDHEAANIFNLSPDRVPRYRREAKRAIESEWEWLHSGWEK